MATYLLTWNPARFPWDDLQADVHEVEQNGYVEGRWSVGVTKAIEPDDRVFLMRLGREPRGITASGWATSSVYEGEHWNPGRYSEGERALYIDIHFDAVLNPNVSVLSIAQLNSSYGTVNWSPQASGMRIPEDIAFPLERDWARMLGRSAPKLTPLAEEVGAGKRFSEGGLQTVVVSRYERSAEARAICIQRHGAVCCVCGMDFGKVFGPIGEGYTHVHHIVPLAAVGTGYLLNPVTDLVPVCPNCHAMLHQRTPPFTVTELKGILSEARSRS